MKKSIANVLDEGLEGLQQGKMVETCIALGGEAGEEVAPLLYTADYLSQVAKAEPSEEFRRSARGRLMARLQQTQPLPAPRHGNGFRIFETLSRALSHLSLVRPNLMRAAVTFAVMAVVIAVTLGVGAFRAPVGTTADLATQCTLTILGGTVSIQPPNATSASVGVDGMTLAQGTKVSTSADGGALLTFFEGSELQLENNTTVVITNVSEAANHSVAITLTQLVGDTWSHVTKMFDSTSKYEIQTPSAVALVRGTRFLTHVDANGQTKVETAEGLVSVEANNEEVYVPVGKKTIVNPGQTPTVPVNLDVPDDQAPVMPRTGDLFGTNQGAQLGLLVAPNTGGSSAANNGQGQTNNGQGQANNGQGQANNGQGQANNGQGQANNGQGQANNGQGQVNGSNVQNQANNNNQSQTHNSGQTSNGASDQTSNGASISNNGNHNGKTKKTGAASANTTAALLNGAPVAVALTSSDEDASDPDQETKNQNKNNERS